MKSFIVCGYGIPEDIWKDQNYLTYLHVAFNHIYASAKNEPALIIPCGGPTSCTPPYTGTEAEKIGEYLEYLTRREAMHGAGEKWRIVLEDTSLSSLENLLFARRIMEEKGGTEVVLFCEETRVARNTETMQTIFKNTPQKVVGIDFDISKNRYLSADVIEKKEAAEREHAQWALQNEENLAKHHAFFEEKFRRLRTWQDEGMSHVDAVTRWYKEGPELLALMQRKGNEGKNK